MPREWILGATLWKCQKVGGVKRRILKSVPAFPASCCCASPSRGVCPISLPRCSGRVLKLEKSISVGPAGNPGQSDGSSGFKERPPVLSGLCQHLPAHFFLQSQFFPVKSVDFWGLFPLSMKLLQSQVKVGCKDSFCPLASRFPSLLGHCWPGGFASASSKNLQQPRANQHCSFPAWKGAQGSFFPQDLEEATLSWRNPPDPRCVLPLPSHSHPSAHTGLLHRAVSDPMGSPPEEEPAKNLLSKGWHSPQLCLAPH